MIDMTAWTQTAGTNRRGFLLKAGAGVLSIGALGLTGSALAEEAAKPAMKGYELPALPYAFDALEPLKAARG